MEQLKYINVVEAWIGKRTQCAQFVKITKQTDLCYMSAHILDDLHSAENRGDKFIKIPSDEHKDLTMRIEDIIRVYLIDNPEYEEEEVE